MKVSVYEITTSSKKVYLSYSASHSRHDLITNQFANFLLSHVDGIDPLGSEKEWVFYSGNETPIGFRRTTINNKNHKSIATSGIPDQ